MGGLRLESEHDEREHSLPLKCLRGADEIYAFDMESNGAWEAFRKENAKSGDLRMPCCGAAVVLRTSPLETRHFAHKRTGPCETAPESKEHLLAKRLVIDGMRRTNWDAKPEQDGATPTGERWKADVLATRGKARVAFEIQWSRQDGAETKRRQERYVASDIRGLWLFRQLDFPFADKDCPAFRMVFDEKMNGVSVWIPSPLWHPDYAKPEERDADRHWSQRIELSRFAEGAVSGRLRFAPTLGATLPLDVMVVKTVCRRCGKETRIVVKMVLAASRIFPTHPDIHVSLPSMDRIPGGPSIVAGWLPKGLLRRYGVGEVKVRRSGLEVEKRASYLSNGCVSCGAMQARWFEGNIDDDPEVALTVDVVFDESWVLHMPGTRNWRRWWFDES
jgi:competence protein CoiA